MTWQTTFTILTVLLVLAALVREIGPPDMVLMAGAVLVTLAGIISPQEFLSGFANAGMLTVGALFVVAAGLRETGALDQIGRWMLGRARTEGGMLARLAPQITGLSAFLNNTAVVAMLLPVMMDWCRKQRVPASRVLLPLSHMTVLGGCITLIGTSTNLVANGLLAQAAGRDPQQADAALAPLKMFELAWVGVPCALLGGLYLLTLGRMWLPRRADPRGEYDAATRDYLANIRVLAECAHIGQTVADAGLRHLPGLFLIEIHRAGRLIAPVRPDESLAVGDVLTFTGNVTNIVDLERTRGLVALSPEDAATLAGTRERRYCEAVLSATSPLIGVSIRDSNFRALYNAAVVAVHRGGHRLTGRVGDIVLRGGDTLLLQTGPHFEQAHRNSPDFYLVSGVEDARPVRHDRSWISMALLVVLIVLLVSEVLNVAVAAFLIAGLMIAARCISPAEARRSVKWDVLLAIAASLALGRAMETSGAAALLASGIVGATHSLGPIATLATVYGVGMVLTELITNNAAAALMFPLALAVAQQTGTDARPLIIAVTVSASFGFATPIGYQTNLMIYGPGGYRFSDFLRVGVPLDLLMWAVATTAIVLVWM